jgi:hypothetical protein
VIDALLAGGRTRDVSQRFGLSPGGSASCAATSWRTGGASLEGLDLGITKVGDAGLAHLKGLKKLRGLVLIGRPVTDAGLAHVREIPNLGYVDLTQTKATPAGVADLKKARPKLKVVIGNYQP